jgi:hypothetical protein
MTKRVKRKASEQTQDAAQRLLLIRQIVGVCTAFVLLAKALFGWHS